MVSLFDRGTEDGGPAVFRLLHLLEVLAGLSQPSAYTGAEQSCDDRRLRRTLSRSGSAPERCCCRCARRILVAATIAQALSNFGHLEPGFGLLPAQEDGVYLLALCLGRILQDDGADSSAATRMQGEEEATAAAGGGGEGGGASQSNEVRAAEAALFGRKMGRSIIHSGCARFLEGGRLPLLRTWRATCSELDRRFVAAPMEFEEFEQFEQEDHNEGREGPLQKRLKSVQSQIPRFSRNGLSQLRRHQLGSSSSSPLLQCLLRQISSLLREAALPQSRSLPPAPWEALARPYPRRGQVAPESDSTTMSQHTRKHRKRGENEEEIDDSLPCSWKAVTAAILPALRLEVQQR
mmetsp:Transcript_69498/g.151753  ORF Transcript_69498/g.151753 Transcript_69498/m.151753 type:complete len:350 (+) Transcript_69498:561-1610(+)